MANLTSFSTTQLDFEAIKEELKTYLERQSEFADYDFEASGLSNVLDVLAYNTHFNGLIANFGLNEAYLPSAQLRSSVINIAQTLGYNIRSRTASRATVNLSLNLQGAGAVPNSITLPSGTRFTTSVDGVTYTFQTRASYIATDDGSGIFNFLDVNGSADLEIYEGVERTKTFIVQESDERQIFVIPDETIDTSLMLVKVYTSYTSSQFTSYTNIKTAQTITSASTYYRIVESPNGYYDLTFGDGATTGLRPVVGNKVDVNYLSCSGAAANGAVSFSPVSQVTVDGSDYDLGVVVLSGSHSGAARQSIESIRQNAPLGFAAQQRLVTAGDYETTILSNYSSVVDATAWGGEDNDPPNYGVVYVGLLFDDGVGTNAQATIKNDISTTLNENLAILSIDVEFVDPVITYLNIITEFSFNPNLTGLTRSTLESQVFSVVQTYVNDNLKSFGGAFRKSALATLIDAYSVAILNSAITVTLQQRLTPVTAATVDDNSASATYTISFPVALSGPDDVNYIITSSTFAYNGFQCSIKNALNSTKLQVVDTNNNVIVDNIGSYIPATGKITLSAFSPGVITSGETFIKINAVPASDSVLKPLRNYYFDIDTTTSFANVTIDRQNNSTTL